ncbi:gluconokinase [Pseudonocardia sp. NPDC046786]|uniref:gluconokinase n=1 Tax=Pseudonocardia sp. NPDC046786 TaxID=3155471 RepID=UPI0033E20ED8
MTGPEPGVAPSVVLMGVSGSGKSTVAALLAGTLGWDFAEGDAFHPESNVAKMSAGIPLTDDDRWPWLDAVAAWIAGHADRGAPAIVTCSALKRGYRERIRGEGTVFVHLAGDRDTLETRLGARLGHFMPAALLDSQLADLDPLEPDENGLEIGIDRSPAEQCEEIIAALRLGGDG